MKVSAQYVKDRAEAEKLDRLIATAKGYGAAGGGIIARANNAEEVQEILDILPGQVQGEFVVKVWQEKGNKGRKGLNEIAYTFILDGTMNTANAVQGIAGGSPSWRELMDLKLQILKMELENKYESKKDDTMTTLAPMIQGIAARLLGGSPEAPVVAPAQPVGAPEKEPGHDGELKSILADVVRFYRNNPTQAREFAPMLKQMANGNGANA